MENKEFDELIKKKLEFLSGLSTDDGWEVFKEKWDEDSSQGFVDEESLDEEFDSKIKKNLQNLRVPFNSNHWVKLKAKLEAEALFKKQLFVAKSVEIVALVLMVATILNIWPIKNDVYEIRLYDTPMVASIPVNKPTAAKFEHAEAQQKVNTNALLEKTTNALVNIVNLESGSIETTNTNINSQENSKINRTIIKSQNFKQNLNEILPFLDEILDRQKNIKADIHDTEYRQIVGLYKDGIDELDIPKRPLGYPDINLVSLTPSKKEKSYASLSVGPRVNFINSPFDPVYLKEGYKTFNTNFSINAKLSKEIGNFEVYTGLGFNNTSYKPFIIEETYNSQDLEISKTSLENISMKTVSVPLGVKYDIVDKSSYQIYTSAGVDINMIVDADYEIKDEPVINSFGPAPPPRTNERFGINESALLSQKEFNEGILNGGSIGDNIYATASISLGYLKNVSKTTSIFVEPRYNHFISSKGIGPNTDKIHGLSIDLGVRYQLN